MKKIGILSFCLLGITLVGAAPPADIDGVVRHGNAAYDSGDFESALKIWENAEELTTDPGQVSFNKAAAHYRLGQEAKTVTEQAKHFHHAENHYRQCSREPFEPRRSLARFGLANSLLQSRPDEAVAVREAIRAYRDCLTSGALTEEQRADAEHNLKLAKQLWLKVRSSAPPPDDEDRDNTGANTSQQQSKPKAPGATRGGNDPGIGKVNVGTEPTPIQRPDGTKPTETNQLAPGQGDLKPIRDDEKLTPLTAREAEAHLEQAMERILRDSRNHRYRMSRPPAPGVKDW